MAVVRMPGLAGMNRCLGCLGCSAAPRTADGQIEPCAEIYADNLRRDFIFIHDTPEGRAAYVALVLEHGVRRPTQQAKTDT